MRKNFPDIASLGSSSLGDDSLDLVSLTLLEALCRSSACIRVEAGAAVLYAAARGVTLAVGHPDIAVVQRLQALGMVRQENAANGTRYVISGKGLARVEHAANAASGLAAQHGPREVLSLDEADNGIVTRNMAESPLLWLYRRSGGLVGEAEFAAGERLRSDMTIARTLPRLSANLERPSQSGVAMALDPSAARMAAQQRVHNALKAVGPELAGVLVDVCGFLKGLDIVESERGWPKRSAKLALSLALSALARHYGLASIAKGVPGKRRTHRWRASADRPDFILDESMPVR